LPNCAVRQKRFDVYSVLMCGKTVLKNIDFKWPLNLVLLYAVDR
jgi:hypothetical protein